jgi:hypothetical protein
MLVPYATIVAGKPARARAAKRGIPSRMVSRPFTLASRHREPADDEEVAQDEGDFQNDDLENVGPAR